MDEGDSLQDLIGAPLCILRLTIDEWSSLAGTKRAGERFSLNFSHDDVRLAAAGSLVFVDVAGAAEALRLGMVRSKRATTTLDTALSLDVVLPLVHTCCDEILHRIDEPELRLFRDRMIGSGQRFEKISPKLGQAIMRHVVAEAANASTLMRLSAHLSRPKKFSDARSMQVDALSMALKAFGADEASSLTLTSKSTALGNVRLMEDAVIEHDARWIPGWTLSASDLTGRATFTSFRDQLEVLTANKRPLEKLLGVDLIYLNKTRGSLVLVQYKMMDAGRTRKRDPNDPNDDGYREWNVAIDGQFIKELGRMQSFDRELDSDGSYRMHSGAFFFKLVKRNAATNSSGILLSLGHFEQLMREGDLRGPGGGLRISYDRLAGHYLRGDAFVELIRSGYIGTRGATTSHMQVLIEASLAEGKAVVAGIQSALRPMGDSSQEGTESRKVKTP